MRQLEADTCRSLATIRGNYRVNEEHPMSKIALVTGASSGIGKACALALLAEGWKVVLVGRRADALQATVQAAGANASNALAVPCDVSHEAEVAKLFEQVRANFGRLDLLFNNAGVFLPATMPGDLSGEDWRRSVDVNFNGAFYCLSHAFKLMKAQSPQGGRIINNGSISAHAPRPGSIAYTATKHAITGMTKAAAWMAVRLTLQWAKLTLAMWPAI